MQRGFLGQPSLKGPVESKDAPKPTHATEEQLQECLDLLRGPGDERKLVGLLMVTRALPAGNHATVKEVYNAVGPSFLARLLLPLRKTPSSSSQKSPLDEETAQKQIGMAALGLAVLSSAAQVDEIASSHEFMQLTPLFLNVARAGGVSSLIIPSEQAELSQIISKKMDPEVDAAAVRDALECTAAVATSCEEGRHIAEESGALQAAADVFKRSFLATSMCKKASASLSSSSSYRPELLWAVRVTAAILGAGPDRAAILESNSAAIETLVPGLAYTLALPALLRREDEKREAAVLNLESLHALLLIVPLPPLPQSSAAQEFLRQGALQSLWARHMRLGIGMILRGKAAAVQRHSALQLAAAMVGMIGPRWLFYPLGQPLNSTADPRGNRTHSSNNNSSTTQGEDEGGAFYQLLVEVVKIETNVLLHDVLSPGSNVPSSAEPGISAEDWKQPQKASESAGERALMMLPCCFFLLEAAIEALAEDNDDDEEEESGNINNDLSFNSGRSGMLSDSVAQRALSSLIECVDVLLQVLEEEEEENEEEKEEAAVAAAVDEAMEESKKEPILSNSDDVDSGLTALKLGIVRVLGRFFAEVPDAFEDRVRKLLPRLLSITSPSSCSSLSPRAAAAAVIDSPPLPQSPRKESAYVDSMLDSFGDFIHKLQSPRKIDSTSKNKNSPVTVADSAEGIAFFLPMLLQVTDPSRASSETSNRSCMAWIEAIVKGGSFRQLVDFAVEIAEVEEFEEEFENGDDIPASFMVVCRILLQIITQIEHLVESSSFSFSSSFQGEISKSGVEETSNIALEFAVADASWPLIPALTEILSNYFAFEEKTTPTTSTGNMSEGEEERVKNIALLAALLAAVLEAVADEADHPDEAHQPQHALFNRNESMRASQKTPETASSGGLGPVGEDDVQQACEIVLQSMHFMHSIIKKENSFSDVSINTEKQQLIDDYRCLVHSAQCLLKSCSAFKETMNQNFKNSASSSSF